MARCEARMKTGAKWDHRGTPNHSTLYAGAQSPKKPSKDEQENTKMLASAFKTCRRIDRARKPHHKKYGNPARLTKATQNKRLQLIASPCGDVDCGGWCLPCLMLTARPHLRRARLVGLGTSPQL